MSTNLQFRYDSILAKAKALDIKVSDDAKWYLQNWVLADASIKLDDDSSFMLSRSLEQELAIKPEAPRPELALAEGDLLPTIPVDKGAKSYHYALNDEQGLAEWGSGSSKDMPMVSASSAEMLGYLDRTMLGYSWDTEDLRNAAYAGKPLQPRLANAATRGHMETWDSALAWGQESRRLLGLFNHPNITLLSAPDGGSGTSWRTKTVAQILADIASLVNTVPVIMNETRHVNTVLWSPRLARFCRQTLADAVLDVHTKIWDVIKETFPEIEFREVRYLDATNARSQGRLATDALFAMIRGDASKVGKVNAMDPTFSPPQQEGLTINMYGEAKRGGIEMAEPLTCVRMDGVFAG
ncbi:MAG TPA: major capsid family protein [Thermoleophilia bacterium]|nr:major capsid family protein [Thermoleophilia bacterium]